MSRNQKSQSRDSQRRKTANARGLEKAIKRAARAVSEAMEQRLLFSTYVVTTTADSGAGSLRQAIVDANAHAGSDTIQFAIADGSSAVKTITPLSQLPDVTDAVSIDATTQQGFTGTPVVQLHGPHLPDATQWLDQSQVLGFRVTGDDSVIRGLAIQGFSTQIDLEGNQNSVRGNYIGLDATGTGVDGASYFGVSVIGNDEVVGGTGVGDRNIISNNGVGIRADGARYVIQGNYIGTDSTGMLARKNADGITARGTDGLIGGPLAAARNIISANIYAIRSESGTTAGLTVQGNYIGTDVTGLAALPNQQGIVLTGASLTIGGPALGDGNIISGNGDCGVWFAAASNSVIQGNLIGVSANGSALGNGYFGIYLLDNANDLIGGSGGRANTIANNGGAGIVVAADSGFQPEPLGNTITQNVIYANTGLGIDLGNDGFTANDLTDNGTGPNHYQNAPYVQAVVATGSSTIVSYHLHSMANSAFHVEWFASAAADASGFGEGQQFLGSTDVTTNAAGIFTAQAALPSLPNGWVVSATATASDGSTSEFSNSLAAGASPQVEEIAPSQPDLEAASDSGASSTDEITNVARPTFSGVATSGASTIHLIVDGREVGSATVMLDGTYRVAPTINLADGSRQVWVTATNASGQVGATSPKLLVTILTTPLPIFISPTNSSGASSDPVDRIAISLTRYATFIKPGSLTLTRDGVSLLPPNYVPSQTLASYASMNDIAALTALPGNYVVTLAAGAATDLAGNPSGEISSSFSYDLPTVVSISVSAGTVREFGDQPDQFAITRTGANSSPLVVALRVDGTATYGTDYVATPLTVTIPAGSFSVDWNLVPISDSVVEPNESVVWHVLAAGNNQYTLGTSSSASVSIINATLPISASVLLPQSSFTSPPHSFTVEFSQHVQGFSADQITLRADNNERSVNFLGDATLETADGMNWTVNCPSGLGTFPQTCSLSITDALIYTVEGAPLLISAPATDFTILPATTDSIDPITDTTAPTSAAHFNFSRTVSGFDLSDLLLSKDGGPNLLTDAQSLVETGDTSWQLGGLANVTSTPGNYTLSLAAATAGIIDAYGSTVTANASISWVVSPLPVSPPPPPSSSIITVRSGNDAYVRDGSFAATNFGAATELDVKKSATSGNTREGYVRFDLANVASAAQISGAKVRFFGKLSAAGSGVLVALYSVAGNTWPETGVKWSSKPVSGATALGTKTVSGTAGAWYEFDVTNYLKQQKAAGATSVSFALKATAASTPMVVFNSDEAASNRPELDVTQFVTPPTPTQNIVLSATEVQISEGKSSSVGVSLAAAPTGNVTVNVTRASGDSDLSASVSQLIFTPGNWSVPQALVLSAAQDADALNGVATFTLYSTGLTSKTLTATEMDDDGAASQSLRATADAYVRDGSYAGQNFGAETSLVVKKNSSIGYSRNAFLKFDLSSVSTITAAKLRLFGNLGTAGSAISIGVYSSTNTTWTESGVKWSNQPTTSASPLKTFSVAGTAGARYEVDLTAFLKSEKTAGHNLVTLSLKAITAADPNVLFNSDEAAVNQPTLVVT